MKEVKEWNGKPRWMWVWDENEEHKVERYVVCILTEKEMKECDTSYPVRTKINCYRHCAELEEYLPFDTAKELIECWNKKKFGNKHPPYNTELEMPLIWVKHKNLENETTLITAFDSRNNYHDSVFLQDIWVDLKDLFETFTFFDGTPIGKIKE